MAKQPKWTKDEIRKMLETSDTALIRGLLAIYKYQTDEERTFGVTREDNGMGFNGADAEFLTQMVVYYNNYKRFSDGQLFHIRKKMLKYAGQLANHANIHNPKSGGKP